MISMLGLPVIRDERGALLTLEALKSVPFEIKRVYCLMDLKKDFPRGFHAHLNLRQLIVCLKGSCRIILDDGLSREAVILNTYSTGLIIESFMWREMHDFSEDCVLMVLASEHYDETDYIRNYEEFKKRAEK
jgi:UDP-2-acetamido-3-amino-2,3-dideoxy-glucuronate N-acetyltransferase